MIEFNSSAHSELVHAHSTECVFAADCDQYSPGHALSFMQRRLASATPSKWRDAIVTELAADGRIQLTTVDDGSELVVWHHAYAGTLLRAGEPVALHSVYHVLAAGSEWLNVSDLTA
jgi:CubicO group peptidase (beta-lactamase class C family)